MPQGKEQNHIADIIANNPNLLELFDVLHCGIALHTPDGIYHYANRAYRGMFGMSGEEPIGRHVRDYFDTAEQGVMLAIKSKVEVMGTTAAKDGVYGVAYRIPLLNARGELQGVLAEVVTAGYDRKNIAEMMKLIQELQKKTYYYEWETRHQSRELHSFERIIGESAPMRKLKALGARFASGRQPVLISGESGTGKDLVAQALHMASERARQPFVAVNCAALPHELIESELFGYGPGAFSGSRSGGMKGKFEQAEAGTIFLDEIGELPLGMQSKLLRVLESGEIQKLGTAGMVYVDFRLIAATNRNLEQMVAEGRFREDLFHRLGVLELSVPPLRSHADDIPHLIRFLEEMIGFKQATPWRCPGRLWPFSMPTPGPATSGSYETFSPLCSMPSKSTRCSSRSGICRSVSWPVSLPKKTRGINRYSRLSVRPCRRSSKMRSARPSWPPCTARARTGRLPPANCRSPGATCTSAWTPWAFPGVEHRPCFSLLQKGFGRIFLSARYFFGLFRTSRMLRPPRP